MAGFGTGMTNPADAAAMARLQRMAQAAARRAWQEMLLAAGVVLAGFGLVVVSLFFVKAATLLALVLRVHAAGLFGLLSACWGAALAEQGLLRHRTARLVRTGLLPGGDYHRAYALLLARE